MQTLITHVPTQGIREAQRTYIPGIRIPQRLLWIDTRSKEILASILGQECQILAYNPRWASARIWIWESRRRSGHSSVCCLVSAHWLIFSGQCYKKDNRWFRITRRAASPRRVCWQIKRSEEPNIYVFSRGLNAFQGSFWS